MESKTEKALRIHALLLQEYGEHEWHAHDPIATLVSTIISQNTNDDNRDQAFERLRERLPTWEQVRDAREAEVREAITPAGLAPTKAPRIQEALARITEAEGELSLDFLADVPLEEAREWLLGLPGVGPKTAAIVLLFALGRPAFPVDTHIHRVTKRLGLIPQKASREAAHDILGELLSPETYYSFHLNVITHGREVCHARNPEHEHCVLQDLCDTYQDLIS